jgi:hypothetical protein
MKNDNSLGWRRLNEEQGFWADLKADIKEARYKKASALDTVFCWLAFAFCVFTILVMQ